MFTENFKALLNEGQFTHELLANGITQLGKVNYAKKGLYFSSFSLLSTGLEKISKLCFILDYHLENGIFPTDEVLKFHIGHDLEKLYNKSKEIIKKNEIKFSFRDNLDDKIYTDIISILSRFAKGDRYSNIDFITQSKYQSDPIAEWYLKVDEILYQKRVSKAKKESIERNAKMIGTMMGGSSSALFFSENKKEIRTIEESSLKTGKAKAVAKYRQLYIAHIIRYWVEILRGLTYISIKSRKPDIPFFGEIFSIFNNSDSYLLTRTNFEKS